MRSIMGEIVRRRMVNMAGTRSEQEIEAEIRQKGLAMKAGDDINVLVSGHAEAIQRSGG